MTQLELYQNLIIKKALPLHEKVIDAFYVYPRHLFVQKYRPRGWGGEWVELTADEIDRHLAELYEDHPLLLYEKDGYVSTISQPSFVLKIIDMMDLHPGLRVFELGSGSGWSSALMSHIVGPTGHIISTEIIPEMAARAKTAQRAFGIKNVTLKQMDGFDGDETEAPFDRIVFTAGSHEFPTKLFSQLKENGLMVFVQSHLNQADSLELIRKHDGKAQILESQPCSFVSVKRNFTEHSDRI